MGIWGDTLGSVYFTEYTAQGTIRKVAAGTRLISTVAGSAQATVLGDGGAATVALLGNPWGLTGDSVGNLFVAQYSAGRVRKVSAAGSISSLLANLNGGSAA